MAQSTFPNIYNTDFSKENNKAAKQYIDAAIDNWRSDRSRRVALGLLYDAHNGIVHEKAYKNYLKTYGENSKTKFIRYRLGRTKINLLSGEFLSLPADKFVFSTNREAINKKAQSHNLLSAMIDAKPMIEGMREEGINVFEGFDIPEKGSKQAEKALNVRTENENIMQHILNYKIPNDKIKSKLQINFKDLMIASECFGKIEKDINGYDTYRSINPKNAIFQEAENDPFLTRSPYMGEVKKMFVHELFSIEGLTEEDRELLEKISEDPKGYLDEDEWSLVNGELVVNTYFLEWKVVETIRTKVTAAKDSDIPYRNELSQEYYSKNKNKIRKDVEKGKYSIEKHYREVLWEGIRVGASDYMSIRKSPLTMQSRLGGNKYRALFNYVGLLFDTTDGNRVSLQEVLSELEFVYDILMFQIRRELNKIKGKIFTYNRAMLPARTTLDSILHRITEDSVLEYSTADEGVAANISGQEIKDVANAIKEIDLGASQSMMILLNLKQDIEQTVDRITGINESRQGLSKATQTATGTTQNVEASRSMTYTLFYYMSEYEKDVYMKLIEKTKINPNIYNDVVGNMFLSDEQKRFLKVTKDISNDDYSVLITDGREQQRIKEMMRSLYEPQINSRELRVSDIAKAEMRQTYTEYLAVLDKAWDELNQIKQQESKQQSESQQQIEAQKLELETQFREDQQQHEKDLIILEGQVKEKLEAIKQTGKVAENTQSAMNQSQIEQQKINGQKF